MFVKWHFNDLLLGKATLSPTFISLFPIHYSSTIKGELAICRDLTFHFIFKSEACFFTIKSLITVLCCFRETVTPSNYLYIFDNYCLLSKNNPHEWVRFLHLCTHLYITTIERSRNYCRTLSFVVLLYHSSKNLRSELIKWITQADEILRWNYGHTDCFIIHKSTRRSLHFKLFL